MTSRDKTLTWVFVVAALWLLLIGVAFATDKPPTQSQDQSQNQTQTASSVSGGGQASSNLYSGDKSTTLALANGAPIPPVCPQGLVPGKRGKRGLMVGIVALSAVCVVPTPEEAAAMQVQRDHEFKLAELAAGLERERLSIERDRVKLESERLSRCLECEVRK